MKFSLVKDPGVLAVSNISENRKSVMSRSSNGKIAQEMGVAKPDTELTVEERGERVSALVNQIKLDDRDYSVKGDVAFNKLYPEGDNTMNAFLKVVQKGFLTDVDTVMRDPNRIMYEFASYLKFCGEQRYSVNVLGFTGWLGTTRSQYTTLMNSDSEVSAVLQKCSNYIAQLRTTMADEAKIPVVQHIFEMANNHGYTRSDPKAALNIEINNTGFSTTEQMSIIDADDF